MNLIYLATGFVLLVYVILVWFLGGLLHLKSPDIWVLRCGLWLLGIIGAVGFLWWRRTHAVSALSGPGEGAGGSEDIDALVREAEAKLGGARRPQGSRIGGYPLIYVLGETGSAKTSIVVHAGLEPELLAGQVYQDSNIVPTPSANLWYTFQTVFAEAGGKLLNDAARWTQFVLRSRQANLGSVLSGRQQAPRAAVLCFDTETLVQGGSPDAIAATARTLRTRLGEISQALGISFPVYVIFTRADRVSFFREYFRNLGDDETSQVLGATLQLQPAGTPGVYAEGQGARVGSAFDAICRSLCGARLEVLPRETDPQTLPATYEFPREFRKVRGGLVQFLVDVCRPSQLTAGPFLRGFYFSGVRPVTVRDAAPEPVAPEPGAEASWGATSIFRAGRPRAQAAAPERSAGSRRVPQWLFLSHLFHDVILKDRVALGASASSGKTNLARRVLLGCAAALCLIFAIGFTVSWRNNRVLESQVVSAARGISASESSELNLASRDALQNLETLRQSVAELAGYERDGAPWRLRWGLYTGNELFPAARRAYFERFRQLLFAQTQARLVAALQDLPAAPGPGDEYGPTYERLKAYLITTSHHEKSTVAFLSPALLRAWSAGRQVDSERLQLAQKQFDFYSDELQSANPFSAANDASAVDWGRRYLAQFAGVERVYQNMLAEASKNNPPVQFNKRFPGSAEVVMNPHEVAGAFTKSGSQFMKDAIRHADRYFSGEQWVLGDQASASIDRAKLEQQLSDRYSSDTIAQWRAFLKAASVVKYANLPDAAKKLALTSGNQSPLLALFWLVSQNTAVDDPKVTGAFQPVQAIVPPASVDRYIAPPNQNYMNGLVALQSSIEQIAAQPGQAGDAAGPVLTNATAAKSAARQAAQAFKPDPEGKVDGTVQKLMEDPITYVEALLRTLGPAELNGKGKALCAQFRPLLAKYPFTPTASAQATLADLSAILRKPDGALWAFYDANLQKLLQRQGTQYVPAAAGGVTLNPAFVAFFNRAASLSDALYPAGSADPSFAYTLKPVPSEGIQAITLRLDGQTLTASGADTTAKQFTWPGSSAREASAAVRFGGTELGWIRHDGLWGVFQFFDEAERWQPAGTSSLLEWVVRAGKSPMTLPSGKPLTVRFELNMGGRPPIFEKGYLSRLGCVADVAR